MKTWNSGRVQDKLINRLERQEKQQAFQRDRFFKFKLSEIHNKLSQALLMEKVIETESPAAISDLILKGLKRALNSSEFDFKYFISPIRDLVSRPNPISLYMTQYIMEVLIDDPHVIEIYGTDLDIYQAINKVVSQISIQFERAKEEVVAQLSRNKSLVPGSREYEVALDQLLRKKVGEPQPGVS
jgi:ribosome-associated translation inhibitor RaiA